MACAGRLGRLTLAPVSFTVQARPATPQPFLTFEGLNTMTTDTTQTAGALKPTVELVTERRCYPTLELAGVALAAIAAQASDFDSITLVAPGASFVEGEFTPTAPEWTSESHEIMLAPLATKAARDSAGNVTKPARLIALVLAPIPTVDALSADTKGLETLVEVWRKEANHRAVRKLRTAENVLAAASEMPLSLESFVTSQSGGGTSGLTAFDAHWLVYSQALAAKVPAWAARFPGGKGKAAIRGALENAARAAALFSELESWGGKGESLFARMIRGLIAQATKEAQPTELLESWLATRDSQTYDASTSSSADIDLDDLFADMEGEGEGEGEDGPGDSDNEAEPAAE
jgi:hypothetical protein